MARKTEPQYISERAIFPTRLRGLMEERKVTQKVLAEVIDMRPQTVSLYITGQSAPDINTLFKIAEYFDVSADWLIGRPDAAKSTSPDAQAAKKYTGLNDASLSRLNTISGAIQKKPYTSQRERVFLYAINEIISSQQFLNILGKIWEAYCIEHQRAFNGLAPKYPDKKEAAQKMDEIKADFESYVRFGLTKERIVSGDVAISVLLNDAREAISSISKDIIKTNILESDKEGDDGKH